MHHILCSPPPQKMGMQEKLMTSLLQTGAELAFLFLLWYKEHVNANIADPKGKLVYLKAEEALT